MFLSSPARDPHVLFVFQKNPDYVDIITGISRISNYITEKDDNFFTDNGVLTAKRNNHIKKPMRPLLKMTLIIYFYLGFSILIQSP